MAKPTIIFDFDGVIADSFDVFIEALQIAVGVKSKKLSPKEIERLRGMSVRQIMTTLGVKPWQLPNVVMRGRKEIAARKDSISIFEGIGVVLKQLIKEYQLVIVSTNAQQIVESVLERNNLLHLFARITADVSVFGKKKILKKEVAKGGFVYIGDEVRDIEAAHAAGLPVISVGWGYNSEVALLEKHPDYFIKLPSEIIGIAKELENR